MRKSAFDVGTAPGARQILHLGCSVASLCALQQKSVRCVTVLVQLIARHWYSMRLVREFSFVQSGLQNRWRPWCGVKSLSQNAHSRWSYLLGIRCLRQLAQMSVSGPRFPTVKTLPQRMHFFSVGLACMLPIVAQTNKLDKSKSVAYARASKWIESMVKVVCGVVLM